MLPFSIFSQKFRLAPRLLEEMYRMDVALKILVVFCVMQITTPNAAEVRQGMRPQCDSVLIPIKNAYSLVISPNRKLIAFVAGGDPDETIMTAEINGNHLNPLTTGRQERTSLTWLPDSTHLLYRAVEKRAEEPGIFYTDSLVLLNIVTRAEVPLYTHSYFQQGVYEYSVPFAFGISPDGNNILLATLEGNSPVVMKRSLGTPTSDWVHLTELETATPSAFDWRPDGKLLAITYGTRVMLQSEDGTLKTSPISIINNNFAWSPDGSKGAFFQNELKVWDVASSQIQQLSENSRGFPDFLRWSPDRIHIAYNLPYQDQTGIYIASINGGTPFRLVYFTGSSTREATWLDALHLLVPSSQGVLSVAIDAPCTYNN